MFRWLCFLVTATPLLAQGLATPEAVLKFYDERAGTVKSWQANFMKMVAQGTNTVTQGGTVRFIRTPNGVEKARADFLMQMRGRELNYRIISGADNVVWQLISVGQQQAIYKLDLNKPIAGSKEDPRKHNPINEVNPIAVFEQYRARLDFSLDVPKEIGGRRFYQLVGRPKSAGPLGSVRAWIGQEDGLLYRVVLSDLRGMPSLAVDLSGVRLNLELDDALFTFTPPEGANIQDLNVRLGQALQ